MGPGPTAGSLVPDDTNGSGVDGGKHLDVGDMSDVSSAVPAVAAEAKKAPKSMQPAAQMRPFKVSEFVF